MAAKNASKPKKKKKKNFKLHTELFLFDMNTT